MNTYKAVRRLLLTILMSALLPVTLPPAFGAEVKVILLGGQSNAVGQALSSGLPTSPVNLQLPQADVLFFYDGNASLTTLQPGSGGNPWPNAAYFGPEISFGRAIADATSSVTYAIIKHGENGTALYNDWDPVTGPSYSRFRDTVSDGMAALQAAGHTTEIVGMVWHQGESDAIENQQAPYESNLSAFMADIRTRYGANLPFLIGEIRRSNGPAFVTVADAQIAVAAADPFASFVPASDLTFSDTYHFNATSLVTLGERFATAYANLARDPVITGVSIADVSSEFNLTTRLATNVIDGTGFTEAQGYHTNTDFGLWNNVGIGLAATTGDDPFPVTITFDLGESHDLDSVKIWNWNAANTLTAGAKDIEILVASEAGGTFTSLGAFTLAQAPGLANVDFGQLIDLSGFPATDDARLIRINITSNHGFAYELAGFAEVRFFGVSNIPDETAPTVSSLNPENTANDVPVTSKLEVVFDENIMAGSGNITIRDLDRSSEDVFDVSDARITVTEATLTINPDTDLAPDTNYAIRIDGTAITDLTGNFFNGIPGDTTWTFRTARTITGVSIADVSSEFNLTTRLATNVIDGTGFTEAQGYHTNTDFGLWNNVGTGLAATTGEDPFPVTITFDLGESHDLDSVKIWNWNAANTLTAGAKDIEILVASEAGGAFTSLGAFTLAQAPGLANVDFGQLIDLSGFPATDDARLVRINITSNHGFAYELAGFSEVRFSGATSAGTTDFSAFISDPVFALDPTDRGFTLDPDHDQIPNGLEAWFGTHPGEFSAGLSDITTDGTVSTFSHPRNPEMPGDLGASYQWSPNLVDWYEGDGIDGPPSGSTVVIISNPVDSTTTVTATASEAFGDLFFRVGVKQQP